MLLINTIQHKIMAQPSNLTAEQIVQINLNAYNSRDIESFMSVINDDIELFEFGSNNPYAKGRDEVRELYIDLFEASPGLNSTIMKRIVFENKVIDHEMIVNRRGSPNPYEMVIIYELKDQKIYKITAIRKK
jgi:hypothetical protein